MPDMFLCDAVKCAGRSRLLRRGGGSMHAARAVVYVQTDFNVAVYKFRLWPGWTRGVRVQYRMCVLHKYRLLSWRHRHALSTSMMVFICTFIFGWGCTWSTPLYTTHATVLARDACVTSVGLGAFLQKETGEILCRGVVDSANAPRLRSVRRRGDSASPRFPPGLCFGGAWKSWWCCFFAVSAPVSVLV